MPWLAACLDSIGSQIGIASEVLVVDNGSGDGSVAYLEARDVRHIAFPENRGFAAAVNAGIKRTEAPLIYVVNVDTVTGPECLSQLTAAFEENASLGGAQPTIIQAGTRPPRLYSTGQILLSDGRALERDAGHLSSGSAAGIEEIFGVCGAACVLSRRMVEAVGAYDESYFAFYEDVDLNVRARASGWSFALVREARVEHIGNATWQQSVGNPDAFNVRLVARNRLMTSIRSLPARSLPGVLVAELGSVVRSARRGVLWAALHGRMEAIARLPHLLVQRRSLRSGPGIGSVDEWLGDRRRR